MKLSDWIEREGTTRRDFAKRVGVSPATITALCNNETAWPSRETITSIVRETGGEVTPNDVLGAHGDIAKRPSGASKAAVG